MNIKVLFSATAIFAGAAHAASADQNITLTRNSRPVTATEAAGGAPLDGMVHDFRITSDSDLLSLLADIDAPLYQHAFGADNAAPNSQLVTYYPALGADSFLQLPSSTVMLGGGFSGPGPERAWGDLADDGPQTDFLFGRLTTNQVGAFSGRFAVSGETTYVNLPFALTLPGPSGPFSEQVSVSAAAPPTAPLYSPPSLPGVEESPTAPMTNPPSAPIVRPVYDPFASAPHSDADVAVSVALTRRSRPVAAHELAGGAPDGYVHEFFVTSATDVIGIRDVEVDAPLYHHRFGADHRVPNAKMLKLFPAVSADSFLDTPDQTSILGSYGDAWTNPEAVWFDRRDSGAQDEFLFGRLTVGETGSFSGVISVAGPGGAVDLPFSFVLPGTADDLALLAEEPSFSIALPLSAPMHAAASQLPEPTAWMLLAAGAPLTMIRRRARNSDCRESA